MSEIHRVLKPNGLGIHLLPTTSWRFWTSIAHYLYILKRIFKKQSFSSGGQQPSNIQEKLASKGPMYVISRILLAGPHGEYPNAIAELYYFNKHHWLKIFNNNGFDVIEIGSNKLFYTGYGIFPNLSLEQRQKMSSLFGNSCYLFLTKPRN